MGVILQDKLNKAPTWKHNRPTCLSASDYVQNKNQECLFSPKTSSEKKELELSFNGVEIGQMFTFPCSDLSCSMRSLAFIDLPSKHLVRGCEEQHSIQKWHFDTENVIGHRRDWIQRMQFEYHWANKSFKIHYSLRQDFCLLLSICFQIG